MVVIIDRIVEQYGTDSREKDGQNLSDRWSVDALAGGNYSKWIPATVPVLGWFLCPPHALQIAMKIVACIVSRRVVTRP